jgi:hypothetical protein
LRPEVTELIAAMVQDAIGRRLRSHPQEPTSDEWWKFFCVTRKPQLTPPTPTVPACTAAHRSRASDRDLVRRSGSRRANDLVTCKGPRPAYRTISGVLSRRPPLTEFVGKPPPQARLNSALGRGIYAFSPDQLQQSAGGLPPFRLGTAVPWTWRLGDSIRRTWGCK